MFRLQVFVVLSEPQPTSPPHSKKVFAGLGVGAIIAIILVVAAGGGIGGTLIYQAAQQPNIQATGVNIPQSTTNPQTSTVVNDGRVANSGSFDYTVTLSGV